MKTWLLAGALLLAASPAVAEDIRFPATFRPAPMLRTPKGWTSQRMSAPVTAYPENDKALAPANALIAGVTLIKK